MFRPALLRRPQVLHFLDATLNAALGVFKAWPDELCENESVADMLKQSTND